MRRLLIEEPVSRAALWSRRLGFFAWLSLALALLLTWLGRLQPFEALVRRPCLRGACARGDAARAHRLRGGLAPRRARHAAAPSSALRSGLPSSPTLAAFICAISCRRPPLDLTTDPDNPPQPLQPLKQLAKGWGPPVEATTTDAGAPRAISALLLDEPLNDALSFALRAAGMSGWHVTTVEYAQPPFKDQARFAATVPSFLIRWPSDAVVRLHHDGRRHQGRCAPHRATALAASARRRWRYLGAISKGSRS